MKFSQFLLLVLKAFGLSFGWYLTILPPVIVFSITGVLAKHFNYSEPLSIFITFAFVQILIWFYCFYEIIDDDLQSNKSKINRELKALNQEKEKLRKSYEEKQKDLDSREERIIKLLSTKTPFKHCANMLSDISSIIFNNSIKWLDHKRNPAHKAAKEVKEIKSLYNKLLVESKEQEYKYEYLLNSFPEIKECIDSDEDLIAISEQLSYSELEETRDRRKDYLSKEEYDKLSESERSQLALDRYVERQKSKWQIGRDYEMCCAFFYIREGYSVELHGIKYRLKDFGRDLIAVKDNGSLFGKEVLIIQCKNWSHSHPIRENVIMQLFGTATEYEISNSSYANNEIIPVLAIPPHTQLSNEAKYFAKKLKIRIRIIPNSDFPRIKCNINNGEKIYHLPFDQQYDRTEIKLKGEFYAHTVAEAVAHGFRRAKRHSFESNI